MQKGTCCFGSFSFGLISSTPYCIHELTDKNRASIILYSIGTDSTMLNGRRQIFPLVCVHG